MRKMDATRARQEFAHTVNQVAYGRRRIVVSRRGKDVAALVPMDDLYLLELCEEEEARKARKRRARSRSNPGKRRAT